MSNETLQDKSWNENENDESNSTHENFLNVIEPTSKLNSSSRLTTEVVLQLFGPKIGPVVSDYSCVYQRKSGRLYAGKNAACFYSNLFGFEHRFMIQWIRVKEIKVDKSNNGVCVVAIDDNKEEKSGDSTVFVNNGQEYVFKNLTNRDEVLTTLLHLHGKAISKVLGVNTGLITNDKLSRNSKQRKKRKGRNIHTSISNLEDIEHILFDLPVSPNNYSIKKQFIGNKSVEINDSEDEQPQKKEQTTNFNENQSISIPKDDFDALWSQMKDCKEPSFREVALHEFPLQCTLEDFHKNCLADNALYSHQFYHVQHIGDSNVNTTLWQKDPSIFTSSSIISRITKSQTETSKKIAQYRQIQFCHKIQTPVGMTNARGTKFQTLYEFPNNRGFILDCTIEMTGLQSLDCFYVDERWIIQPNYEHESNENSLETKQISITTKFELRFVKKTWWKQIILNMTIAETKKWFENYTIMMQDCLAGDQKKLTKQETVALDVDDTTIPKKKVDEESKLCTISTFSYFVSFCLLLCILYISFICVPYRKQILVKIASMEKEIIMMKEHIETIEDIIESSKYDKMQQCYSTAF